MFIAHLPAGYLLTKSLQKKLKTDRWLWLGLLASILPDFDLAYFYLIDRQQHLHHSYWIHLPAYWLGLFLLALAVSSLGRLKAYRPAILIFFANIFLHLILDTFVGRIQWLYPFSSASFYLFTVPVRYGFWVWNFAFHWTFLVEIAICVWALVAWCSRPGSRPGPVISS